MRLRSSLVLVVALLSSAIAVGSASAAGGARLSFVAARWTPAPSFEVTTVDPSGHRPSVLVGGRRDRLPYDAPTPQLDSRPSWSADGGRLSFVAYSLRIKDFGIYVADADGSGVRLVPHSPDLTIAGDPILTPDGRSIVFYTYRSSAGHPGTKSKSAIASLPVGGGRETLLTPWSTEEGLVPTSFSPDGKSLAATRYTSDGQQVDAVTIELASGRETLLAKDAQEPVYAPDSSVAVVRNHPLPLLKPGNPIRSSDLLEISELGAKTVEVLHSGGSIAWPTWDPSGSRIAYTEMKGRMVGEGALLEDNSLGEVNADGTCPTVVAEIHGGGSFAGSTWQPGAGRGAGPISC